MDGDDTTFRDIYNLDDFISAYEGQTGMNFYSTDFFDVDGNNVFDIVDNDRTFQLDELVLFSVVQHETVKIDKDGVTYVHPDRNQRPFCIDLKKMQEKYGPIEFWDVSEIEDMSYWFHGLVDFNANISRWDTRNVTNMTRMFDDCINFNCDISRWDVRKVQRMDGMFYHCYKFNQPIGKWQPDKLVSCNQIFCFNIHDHDISNWKLHEKFRGHWMRNDIFCHLECNNCHQYHPTLCN